MSTARLDKLARAGQILRRVGCPHCRRKERRDNARNNEDSDLHACLLPDYPFLTISIATSDFLNPIFSQKPGLPLPALTRTMQSLLARTRRQLPFVVEIDW